MPVCRVESHEAVEDNVGKVAIERGPVVYCAEGADNGGAVRKLALHDGEELQIKVEPGALGDVTTIQGETLALIPYYAWSHRGKGEMAVWLERPAG